MKTLQQLICNHLLGVAMQSISMFGHEVLCIVYGLQASVYAMHQHCCFIAVPTLMHPVKSDGGKLPGACAHTVHIHFCMVLHQCRQPCVHPSALQQGIVPSPHAPAVEGLIALCIVSILADWPPNDGACNGRRAVPPAPSRQAAHVEHVPAVGSARRHALGRPHVPVL